MLRKSEEWSIVSPVFDVGVKKKSFCNSEGYRGRGYGNGLFFYNFVEF